MIKFTFSCLEIFQVYVCLLNPENYNDNSHVDVFVSLPFSHVQGNFTAAIAYYHKVRNEWFSLVHFNLRHIKLLLSTLLSFTKGALGHPLKFFSIVLIYFVFILMLMVFNGLIRKVDSHLTNGNKELDVCHCQKNEKSSDTII